MRKVTHTVIPERSLNNVVDRCSLPNAFSRNIQEERARSAKASGVLDILDPSDDEQYHFGNMPHWVLRQAIVSGRHLGLRPAYELGLCCLNNCQVHQRWSLAVLSWLTVPFAARRFYVTEDTCAPHVCP